MWKLDRIKWENESRMKKMNGNNENELRGVRAWLKLKKEDRSERRIERKLVTEDEEDVESREWRKTRTAASSNQLRWKWMNEWMKWSNQRELRNFISLPFIDNKGSPDSLTRFTSLLYPHTHTHVRVRGF
jgi:hypothetical protein